MGWLPLAPGDPSPSGLTAGREPRACREVSHPVLPSPELLAAFDTVCTHVGRDWRRLARRLELTEARIDAIEERFPRNLPEQVREMLRVWKNTRKEAATVAQLVAALRACQMNLVADFVEAGTKQAQGI